MLFNTVVLVDGLHGEGCIRGTLYGSRARQDIAVPDRLSDVVAAARYAPAKVPLVLGHPAVHSLSLEGLREGKLEKKSVRHGMFLGERAVAEIDEDELCLDQILRWSNEHDDGVLVDRGADYLDLPFFYGRCLERELSILECGLHLDSCYSDPGTTILVSLPVDENISVPDLRRGLLMDGKHQIDQ